MSLGGDGFMLQTPVSYTHLDVYKRQAAYSACSMVKGAGAAVFHRSGRGQAHGVGSGDVDHPSSTPNSRRHGVLERDAVSYTHLDVYKRQACTFAVQLAHQMLQSVVRQRNAGGVKGISFDQISAGLQVLAMDVGDDVGPG